MGKEVGRAAQVSMEFLGIMGFILLLMIPLLAIFITQSGELQDEVSMKQSLQVARSIADSAESVYYLGAPSKTRIKVYIPEKVTNMTINGREIIFHVDTINGPREIFWTSEVNMSGSIDPEPGIHHISVQAIDSLSGAYVSISE